jgi:hypothetical protein
VWYTISEENRTDMAFCVYPSSFQKSLIEEKVNPIPKQPLVTAVKETRSMVYEG